LKTNPKWGVDPAPTAAGAVQRMIRARLSVASQRV
jgi:hypothetical protein